MTIHQLSIFLENKKGTLLQVLNVLKDANIQIVASTIADTQEYGIYRIICNNSAKAFAILKEAGIHVVLSDVYAIELDDKPGSAASVIQLFSEKNININYMYSFLFRGKGILVFRTNDAENTVKTISLNNLRFISEENLNHSTEK